MLTKKISIIMILSLMGMGQFALADNFDGSPFGDDSFLFGATSTPAAATGGSSGGPATTTTAPVTVPVSAGPIGYCIVCQAK